MAAGRMGAAGSFTIFSGVAAAKIAVGMVAVAITNGAAEVLARSLALELAPIRVNAVSPGVIDTRAWDELGERGKATSPRARRSPRSTWPTRPGPGSRPPGPAST
jgi:NAD(P)-dependent dehydrogenase (short-subunit alcohol dehydrogenase family)